MTQRTMTSVSPQEDLGMYLRPTWFLESDAPSIVQFAERVTGDMETDVDKGVRLFRAVRDEIRYDPYHIDLSREGMRASAILARGYGYCVAKAIVLAAAARAVSIPSRLGFADVRNHLTTERLRRFMKTDTFVYHGFTELFLGGRWLKATPTFNMALCERFGVKPLEFNGHSDALFHEYDREGKRHMEYILDHGSFVDLPYETILASFRKSYPGYFSEDGTLIGGNFEKEAVEDRKKA